jgi:type I restriction enzyme M protein
LSYEDLVEFVEAYKPGARNDRVESERFRSFSYTDLQQRDKLSLDVAWLRDDSLEDSDNLRAPEVLASEIIEELEAALLEFTQVSRLLAVTTQPAEGAAPEASGIAESL